MPHFETLQTSLPKPISGFVIDSDDAYIEFIRNIHQHKQYDNIYIAEEMLPLMKKEARNFPPLYQQAFKETYPTLVGLVAITEGLLDSAAVAQHSLSEVSQEALDTDELLATLDDFVYPEDALSLGADNARSDDDDNFDFDDEGPIGDNAPEEGDDEALGNITSPARTLTPARKAANKETDAELLREFNYLPAIDKKLYHQMFDDDPFGMLAQVFNVKSEQMADERGSKSHKFKQHLDKVIPIVAFALIGARQDLVDPENGADKGDLIKKMQTFEAILKLLQSMRALANNKSRFSEDYFESKVDEIVKSLPEQERQGLSYALSQVAGQNLSSSEPSDFYQHKKGSTAFDPTLPKQEIKGHKKRVCIEHEAKPDSSNVVTGKFSYSRKDVIGVQTGKFSGIKKIFAQRKDQLAQLQAQVEDFVMVALNDYKKGTSTNPIYLQPSKGNQSELCLAILLECKHRAIIEGRVLFASDDNGKRIEITPSTQFTDDEKTYFSHFAEQVPKVKASGVTVVAAGHTAGYQLLKDVKIEGTALKEFKSPTTEHVYKAMSQHLEDRVSRAKETQEARIAEAVAPLREAFEESITPRANM